MFANMLRNVFVSLCILLLSPLTINFRMMVAIQVLIKHIFKQINYQQRWWREISYLHIYNFINWRIMMIQNYFCYFIWFWRSIFFEDIYLSFTSTFDIYGLAVQWKDYIMQYQTILYVIMFVNVQFHISHQKFPEFIHSLQLFGHQITTHGHYTAHAQHILNQLINYNSQKQIVLNSAYISFKYHSNLFFLPPSLILIYFIPHALFISGVWVWLLCICLYYPLYIFVTILHV